MGGFFAPDFARPGSSSAGLLYQRFSAESGGSSSADVLPQPDFFSSVSESNTQPIRRLDNVTSSTGSYVGRAHKGGGCNESQRHREANTSSSVALVCVVSRRMCTAVCPYSWNQGGTAEVSLAVHLLSFEPSPDGLGTVIKSLTSMLLGRLSPLHCYVN